jgi:hypothetical protein
MAITRIGNIASTIPDDSIQNAKFSNIVNFKNIIINGDMSIAQRGTSVTGSTGGGYLTCDRWNFNIGGAGTWTQTQSTDVPTGQGFPNSFKLDCTTADASLGSGDIMQVQQRIEGQNLQYLKKGTANAESLTCSFWVKSNKTGTYIVEFRERDNNRTISKSYTIDSANTWEKKILTFAGDTTGTINNDNGNSLQVNWWLAAGSNYSSGTLQTSWGTRVDANRAVGQVNLADSTANYINITGVQLEAGTSASDFEFLPVDVNLQRCQRYCFSEPAGDAYHVIMNGFNPNTSLFIGIKHLPVPMRAEPSITTSGNWQTAGTVDKTATSFTITDSAVDNLTSVQFRANVSSVIAGDGANFRNANDATAKFILSSEL